MPLFANKNKSPFHLSSSFIIDLSFALSQPKLLQTGVGKLLTPTTPQKWLIFVRQIFAVLNLLETKQPIMGRYFNKKILNLGKTSVNKIECSTITFSHQSQPAQFVYKHWKGLYFKLFEDLPQPWLDPWPDLEPTHDPDCRSWHGVYQSLWVSPIKVSHHPV